MWRKCAIAQVHEEVEKEESEQQIARYTTPNRSDERGRGQDRDRKRLRDKTGPPASDGWTVAASKNRTSFESSRIKNTFSRPGAYGCKDVTLRGADFTNWVQGSSGGGLKDHEEVKRQENRFNVLFENMSVNPIVGDNRRGTPSMGRLVLGRGGEPPQQSGFGSKSMPLPSTGKESAVSIHQKFVGNDRSKFTSHPKSRDNSSLRENDVLKGAATLHAESAKNCAIAIIEEYAHNADPNEAKFWIKERYSSPTIKHFVHYSLDWVLDRDATKRRLVGQLCHDILLENLLSVDQFLVGVQKTLSMTEEFAIDIPHVCEYLGDIFAPCLIDNAISLQRLLELSMFANSKSATVFACIIAKAAKIISPKKVADLWNSSGLSWSNIVPDGANVDDCIARQEVEFTKDCSKSSCNSGWDRQEVETELLKLFKRPSNDEIFLWIDANIGHDANSSKFVRALVTALVESQAMTSNYGSSIHANEDFENKMKHRLQVVRKYVDGNDNLELQCIYALQALCVAHQHPRGLLETCFNAFYDSEVVSEEAFDEWVKSQDPEEQEGKGVCVAAIQNFM